MPMHPNQKVSVSLGCGSLILIALIVFIFGNIAKNDLSDEIQKLDAEIQQVEGRMENIELLMSMQRGEIEELQTLIDTLRQELRQAAEKLGTD